MTKFLIPFARLYLAVRDAWHAALSRTLAERRRA